MIMPSIKQVLLAVFIGSVLALPGCGTTPSAFEQRFYDIATNYTPRVVVVTNTTPIYLTNHVMAVEWRTNVINDTQISVVPVTVTQSVLTVSYLTNTVTVTNLIPQYVLTPNASAGAVGQVAGVAASPWGAGGLATGAVGAIFALWAGYRNRQLGGKNDALSQSAGTLAQIIETGREVLKTTPQGQQADAAFKQWMIQHQNITGTLGQISGIVADEVSNEEAKRAANDIKALVTPGAAKA